MYRALGHDSPSFVELGKEGAQLFHDAISKSKEGNPFSAAVYVYSSEEYAGFKNYITQDGKAGFSIKPDGDIIFVFNYGGAHKGVIPALIHLAVQQGDHNLDAFDTVLPQHYAGAGFDTVARVKWNDEYAPEGWSKETYEKYSNGEPDVVLMVYNRERAAPYSQEEGKVVEDWDDGAALQVPKYSTQRGSNEPQGNAREDGRGNTPGAPGKEYGKTREHSTRVEATHFSTEERAELDSSAYGSGLKGEEAKRLSGSMDPRLLESTYFYINEGNGITPETGVGTKTHRVALNNLYNVNADPLGLYNRDLNKMEFAVINAGFDGYYVPGAFQTQSAAALLGKHKIPVEVFDEGLRQLRATDA